MCCTHDKEGDPIGRYIAIAGNMGAGKSTLVDFLKVRFGVTPYFEPNDENPYLKDFYSDMKRWAFSSQIYFLQKKFALHLQLEKEPGVVVQDRSIYEDAEIFARNLNRMRILDGRDWETYEELYLSIRSRLRPPDLLLYLRCSTKTVMKRIKMRGREEENSISRTYVKKLNSLYEQWFAEYTLSPTVVIDTEKLDYVSDMVHQLDLLDTIGRHLE